MNLDLYTEVILVRDVPGTEFRAGDVGVIVERHGTVNGEIGYSVEFFDMVGKTVGVVAVPESQLRQPTALDRPAARIVPA